MANETVWIIYYPDGNFHEIGVLLVAKRFFDVPNKTLILASRNQYDNFSSAKCHAKRLAKENNLVYIPDEESVEDCYLD